MDHNMSWIIKCLVAIIMGVIIFLPIMIAAIKKKKQVPIQVGERGFIMYIPKGYFWMGIVCAVFFFLFMILLLVIIGDSDFLLVVTIFGLFALMGTYLSVYTLLWKAVVEEKELTIYRPFLSIKSIKFYEITSIIYKQYALIGYHKNKKIFMIDSQAIGLELLYEQLYQDGKIERIQKKENFIVKENGQTIGVNTFTAIFFTALFVFVIILREQFQGVLYLMTSGLFCILFLYEWLSSIMWKLTISVHTIEIQSLFKRKKVYKTKEITLIYMEKGCFSIFIGHKQVAKIHSNDKNFYEIIQYFADEGILFYGEENI